MDFNFKINELKNLTNQFGNNIRQYKSNIYDESNTRVDFIDKFFELLDWDVRNIQGYSEQYREVIREDKIQIEGKQKAPDYSFRIGKERKFFVEAKKPSVNVKDDIVPAFQIRRYGYTAKLPLSILTDFEEFAIYDTRIKPDKNDKASVGRIFYCTYDEYEKHFEFIYNTFSKNAILKGSFDKYIEQNKNKRGTSEVDKELLKLVEDWRTELAKSIALRNPEIDIYNLNIAVQRIIDRIIFLRIAEDKEIEPYEQLLQLVSKDKEQLIFSKLNEVFIKANKKYNAGLFNPEKWLTEIKIDDKTFSNIIKGLYYPECPYEFSILPIEILGNIYEQFLGKTIKFRNVKEGHTAIIEEKPEVRKAGGVYYTPQYIVNYIVENTVGEKLRQAQSLDGIPNVKICDPACGSGSFLVGAYQYLLNYHLDYWTNEKNLKKGLKTGKIYQEAENSYRLAIEEKQRILINNIYGVDIDRQAVEVTKLSLYLKLLENEGKEAEGLLFKHTDIKLLPTLDNNIKCGNSLIGSDFYKNKDLSLFGNDEMRKVNVFDWVKEYSEIFIAGGFDVVIGNPPYVNIVNIEEVERKYLQNKYSITKNKVDLYSYFIELILKRLLKINGLFGYIVSNTWLAIDSFKPLRKLIFEYGNLLKICPMPIGTFKDAIVETIIFIFEKDFISAENIEVFIYIDSRFIQKNVLKRNHIINDDNFLIIPELNRDILDLLKKIEINTPIRNFLHFSRGVKTSNDEKFILNSNKNEDCFKLLRGKNIQRYFINYDDLWLWYRPDLMKEKTGCLPHTKGVFQVNEKIILQGRSGRNLIAFYDNKKYFVLDTAYFSKNIELKDYNLKYFLSLINSKLINFWYGTKFKTATISGYELHQIPVKTINFSDQQEKQSHDQLVSLVDQMLGTQKLYHNALTESDKKLYKQKIEIIDRQIDDIVYKLYNLSEEEIRIVEKN